MDLVPGSYFGFLVRSLLTNISRLIPGNGNERYLYYYVVNDSLFSHRAKLSIFR